VTRDDQEQELRALTAELVEVQDQLLAFYDLAGALRGHLDPGPLLTSLVTEAMRLIRATGGFATLKQQGQSPLVASPQYSLLQAAAQQLSQELGDSPQLVKDLPEMGSVVLVSIPLRGDARAALGLVRQPGEGFGAPDRRLAAALAAHAGAQLESALLYQERLSRTRQELEFELARTVQAGLTPALPLGYPDIDLFAESRTASEVGGDFFDFALEDRERLVCTFGDVAGKGVPAALLVGMTRSTIRAAARGHPWASLTAVLRRANAQLYRDFSQLGLFATVFLARFESTARRLIVANAGHSPVIYRPAGGRARIVEADALPIGVLPDWDGLDVELRLGPGDVLIAATDGFSEATDANGELFGHDRLLELADRLPDHGAADIAAKFFDATDAFGGSAAVSDDRTLLIIRGVGNSQ
jgi:sigma-B regulation protein RsbU (phosphoserine phosphatase)